MPIKYPPYDRKLKQVESWVDDLAAALLYCPDDRRRVAVQAGGAVGVWPLYLADWFDVVYTFEPNRENFDCLTENTKHAGNIESYRAALGAEPGKCGLINPDFESDNAGTWHMAPGDDVPVMYVDGLPLDCLDFLCLDVEGFELDALLGAEQSIKVHRPVIMLEEKPLPHMTRPPEAAREWLETNFGYYAAARAHRDVVLIPA